MIIQVHTDAETAEMEKMKKEVTGKVTEITVYISNI
jgi:hypothetical protein